MLEQALRSTHDTARHITSRLETIRRACRVVTTVTCLDPTSGIWAYTDMRPALKSHFGFGTTYTQQRYTC